MLQFATQFSDGSYQVKEILMKTLDENDELRAHAHVLAQYHNRFPNLSDALDFALYKNDFGFVIVIDDIAEDLSSVIGELARKPEIITLKKFQSEDGKVAYLFDELLGEVTEAKSSKVEKIVDIDTIVCPARPEGFKSAFLEKKAWWAVRVSPAIIPRLKYVAMYEKKPISAINWAGRIESIEPFEETGKYKIFLSEIFRIGPIIMDQPRLAPQAPRYTRFDLVEKGKSLSDIF
jgi:hypothetical protein